MNPFEKMREAVNGNTAVIEEAERQVEENRLVGVGIDPKDIPKKAKSPSKTKGGNWLKEWEEKHDQ